MIGHAPTTLTGAQYSLTRATGGLYIALAATVSAWQTTGAGSLLDAVVALLGLAIAAGRWRRAAAATAVALWLIAGLSLRESTTTPARADLLDSVSWLIVLLLGLLHAWPRPGEPGAMDSRGFEAVDWRPPRDHARAAWLTALALTLVLAAPLAVQQWFALYEAFDRGDVLGYALPVGIGAWLLIPAWIAAAASAGWSRGRRTAPWAWWIMLAANVLLASWLLGPLLALGLVALQLPAFEPRWMPQPRHNNRETILFDGSCGLCHRWVLLCVFEDREGRLFHFAPRDSDYTRRILGPQQAEDLPRAVAVIDHAGRVLIGSRATLHILHRLGGLWRLIAMLGYLVPMPLRAAAYRALAAIRHGLFTPPPAVCPPTPPAYASRFHV